MLLPAEAIHESGKERRDLFTVAAHDLVAQVHRPRLDEVGGRKEKALLAVP